MFDVKFTVIDENPEVVTEYAKFLGPYENWTFQIGNILQSSGDALVAPTNGCGDMREGINKLYLDQFGERLERSTKAFIREYFSGMMPIDESQCVPISSDQYEYLICTPVVRDEIIIKDKNDMYKAAIGLFTEIARINQVPDLTPICDVTLPGLGTGCGGLSAHDSGLMVAKAYRDFLASQSGE